MSTSDYVDELLLRWQELRRHNQRPSVRELCADHPSLVEELTRRIEAFESMELLLGMGQPTTVAEPSAEHGTDSAVPQHLAEKLLPLGYELLEVIDHGGMGVVYKANQVKLTRTVALKMIAGFRASRKQLARFHVEVEAVARLQHPHIVQIYEVGEVDGHSFFSMEYVAGGNLARRLASGPLHPVAAAELIEPLARAIHHAHTRGIVHRDLKPGNILLSAERGTRNAELKTTEENEEKEKLDLTNSRAAVPKIADFGLAKRLGADSDHSATGEIIGTPSYMAPEQAEGKTEAIGPACDVYALGAILYEALTGRPPFHAKSVMETLRRVISDEPDRPRGFQAGIPRDLEAICLKCLEKKPGDRYPSAEALATDLHRFLAGLPVIARPLSAFSRAMRWVRRRPGWVALGLLVVAAAVAVAGRGYAERERRRARAVAVAPQAREILHRHCFECHGADPAKAERKFLVLDRSSLLDLRRKSVVPGHPEESRLILRIEDGTMPPEEEELRLPRVSELELGILKEWIAGGAPEFPPEDPQSPTPPVVPRSELAAEVKSIFIQHCHSCHQRAEAKGGIKIINHGLLVAKRKVVVPGKPDESELYQLLVATGANLVMPPPTQPRLSPDEIEKVRRWIEAAAPPFPKTPTVHP